MPKSREEKFVNLDPEFSKRLRATLIESPWMKVWEGYRSDERQDMLFERGTTKARAGQSAHNYGLAADCVMDPRYVTLPEIEHKGKMYPSLWYRDSAEIAELWRMYGEAAERNGLEWGGRWGKMDNFNLGWDIPHIQMRDWRKLKDQ